MSGFHSFHKAFYQELMLFTPFHRTIKFYKGPDTSETDGLFDRAGIRYLLFEGELSAEGTIGGYLQDASVTQRHNSTFA
jgi:hypothetical protein